jgi:hypothetical protein
MKRANAIFLSRISILGVINPTSRSSQDNLIEEERTILFDLPLFYFLHVHINVHKREYTAHPCGTRCLAYNLTLVGSTADNRPM